MREHEMAAKGMTCCGCGRLFKRAHGCAVLCADCYEQRVQSDGEHPELPKSDIEIEESWKRGYELARGRSPDAVNN